MTACRCMIVDDHPIVRCGVRELLLQDGVCSEVREISTGRAALEVLRREAWDLLVLDMSLPDMHGLEVLQEAKALRPLLPVLILSLYPERAMAIRAIKSGAAGYLAKESSSDELLAAVRRVLQGGRYITSGIAEHLAEVYTAGETGPLHGRLTNREMQVLRLLGQGKTASMIAGDLCISVKTVSTYRARILEKLKCDSTAAVIRYAIEARLVD